MKSGLSVIDCMTKTPITVTPKNTVLDAAKLMKKEHIGSVIVSEKHKLVGILSEQDIIYKVIAEKKDPKKVIVEEIMSKNVVSITPDKDITDAMMKMSELKVRRLPVVEDNQILGMLTQKDILKIEPELFELIVDKIDLREEENKPIFRVGDREGLCELCGNYTSFLFNKEGSLVCKDCRKE